MRYGYGRPLYLVAPPRKVPPRVDAHPNVGLEGKGVDGARVDGFDGGLMRTEFEFLKIQFKVIPTGLAKNALFSVSRHEKKRLIKVKNKTNFLVGKVMKV